MATIQDHYDKLAEPYRTQAIRNFENYGIRSRDLTSSSVSIVKAIDSFSWSSTPEGSSYWSNIVGDIRRNGLRSRYTNAINLTSINFLPLWARELGSVKSYIRDFMEVHDDHKVEPLAINYTMKYDKAKFCRYYENGRFNDKKEYGLFIYKNYRSGIGQLMFHQKDGVMLIFKVVKPSGTTSVISEQLQKAHLRYVENSQTVESQS